jgi:hypothetical protein
MGFFKYGCLLLLSGLLIQKAASQIVNIERARMVSDSTGWLGNAGIAVSVNKNKESVFSTDLDVQIQYKSKKSLYLALFNYGFLKGGGKKLIDYTFLHFRYNYKISKLLRWEAFVQIQNNVVSRIKSRYLLGSGPRFKLLSNKTFHLYAASLLMYEQEQELVVTKLHQDLRSSNYISFSIFPHPSMEITSTSFFQPLIKKFSDYRILNQVSIKVKSGKHVGIKINWSYLNDKFPAAGIPSVNYTLTTGFDYDF